MSRAVSSLLALEIQRVVEDVDERRELLVRLWGMHRDRWPLAQTAFSRWKTLRSEQLDELAPDVVVRVDAFYAALEDWLTYVQTTEDMPLHLDWNWRQHHTQLAVAARRALEVLDPAPTADVPEVDRDGRTFLEGFALRRRRATPAWAEE